MGIFVSCDQCGYQERFREGKGMFGWAGFENLKLFLNSRQLKRIAKIIGNLTVTECDINMATYLCHHCGSLNERLDYDLIFGKKGHYSPPHNCSKCRNLLIEKIDLKEFVNAESDGDVRTFSCPKCRHSPLAIGMFLWD